MPKSYSAADIQILTGIEAVRKRPSMYLGSTDPRGLAHLVLEVVSNAVDQYAMGHSSRIVVRHSGREITVEDDGDGFPLHLPDTEADSLGTRYLTQLHATPTADEHAPHLHMSGLHGVGIAVVNALCTQFEVTSWQGDRRYTQRFERGVIMGPVAITSDANGRGTCVVFTPDASIFGDNEVDWHQVRGRLFEFAHLIPGVRIHYQDERFYAPAGLRALAPVLSPTLSGNQPPVHLQHRIGETQIDLVLHFGHAPTQWVSYSNGRRTSEHGSHVDGVNDAIAELGWQVSAGVVHTIHHDVRYAGPTRDKLDVPNLRAQLARELPTLLQDVFED